MSDKTNVWDVRCEWTLGEMSKMQNVQVWEIMVMTLRLPE